MRLDRIGAVRAVNKPTDAGEVTAVRIFDLSGEEVVILSDHRCRGESESDGWRRIVSSVAAVVPRFPLSLTLRRAGETSREGV